MTKSVWRKLAAVLTATLAFGTANLASAADVPTTLTHQGRILDDKGAPITESLSITFAIYDGANDTIPVWNETLDIAVEDGFYSATLGAGITLKGIIDGKQKFLGISVGNDAEMTPRAVIQSVPYAMIAGNAIGDITPTTVSISGTTVIDATGKWVGDPTGLKGDTGDVGPQGIQGIQGPIGLTGPQGVDGMVGPMGPAGMQGPQGIQGPAGVAGAPGAAGAAGPAGPSGVVSMTSVSGPGNNPNAANFNAAATYEFVGATAQITLQAGQKAYMIAHKAMGALGTAAAGLRTFPCFRLNSAPVGTLPTVLGGGVYDQQVPANTRIGWLTTWVFVTGAGNLTAGQAYNVGMCAGFGSAGQNVNWSSNEYGGISVAVANSN